LGQKKAQREDNSPNYDPLNDENIVKMYSNAIEGMYQIHAYTVTPKVISNRYTNLQQ
jgi:hypothetical protein